MTGTDKCKLMKQIRADIAKEYGIEGFEYKPCPNKFECRSMCSTCNKETEELERLLKEKGVEISLPRDLNMPKELIGVMGDDVWQEMKCLGGSNPLGFYDYDKFEYGRVLTRNREKGKRTIDEWQEKTREKRKKGIRETRELWPPYHPEIYEEMEREADRRQTEAFANKENEDE